MLKSRRISRIAIHPQRQRQGIGQRMIEEIIVSVDGCDYLSVSFGFTGELWRFWQRCGFRLVRLGTHREASSGCYTAMAVYPLNEAGKTLAEREQQRFVRDEAWLASWRDENTPTVNLPSEAILTEDDWQDLAGFAFAHRPLMAAVGSLNRLVTRVAMPLPALRSALQPDNPAVQAHGGRRALLARLREETADALTALDPQRTQRLAEKVKNLQFF
jgi:tRNA(Met) cytidine acetyltransferase